MAMSLDDLLTDVRRRESEADGILANIERELGQLERQATALRAQRARAVAIIDDCRVERRRLEQEKRRTQTEAPRWQR